MRLLRMDSSRIERGGRAGDGLWASMGTSGGPLPKGRKGWILRAEVMGFGRGWARRASFAGRKKVRKLGDGILGGTECAHKRGCCGSV